MRGLLMWKEISVFCSRTYWTRLLILQEVTLATHAKVYCGSVGLFWIEVARFIFSVSSITCYYGAAVRKDAQSKMRNRPLAIFLTQKLKEHRLTRYNTYVSAQQWIQEEKTRDSKFLSLHVRLSSSIVLWRGYPPTKHRAKSIQHVLLENVFRRTNYMEFTNNLKYLCSRYEDNEGIVCVLHTCFANWNYFSKILTFSHGEPAPRPLSDRLRSINSDFQSPNLRCVKHDLHNRKR